MEVLLNLCLLRLADSDLRSLLPTFDAHGHGDLIRDELRTRAIVEEHPLECPCGSCPD